MVWEQAPDREDDRPFWPDIVIEDYPVVVGMVGRYALYTGVPEFTFGQLEGHLLRLNVELYDEKSDWLTLFAEMQADIVRDLAEAGRRYEWRQRRVGKVTLYSLVDINAGKGAALPDIAPADAPSGPAAESAEAEGSEAERGSDGKIRDTRLDRLFEGLADRRVRMKDLPGLLQLRFGIDEDEANKIIKAARQAGRLHKHTAAGVSFLSLDAPAEPARRRRKDMARIEAERGLRPLNETELAAAERIMDLLSASGTHVSEGSTVRRIERELELGLSPSGLRRLLRHMQAMRLIALDHTANYGPARKSARVRVRSQGMKLTWGADRDGYVGQLRDSQMRE